MNNTNFIKEGLALHNIPVYEADLPYIEFLLQTVIDEQESLQSFPGINHEFPVVVFDKELIR